MRNHTVHFAVLAALLFAGTAVSAADSDKVEKHDVTLKSGKVLKDAYILDRKPNGITFGYKDGCSFVLPTCRKKSRSISTMIRTRPPSTKRK